MQRPMQLIDSRRLPCTASVLAREVSKLPISHVPGYRLSLHGYPEEDQRVCFVARSPERRSHRDRRSASAACDCELGCHFSIAPCSEHQVQPLTRVWTTLLRVNRSCPYAQPTGSGELFSVRIHAGKPGISASPVRRVLEGVPCSARSNRQNLWRSCRGVP